MSDIDFLNLFAKFSGFRVLVLANRLGCTNDLARRAHDRLVQELRQLSDDMRWSLKAQHRLLLNTDPAKSDDLAEWLWNCECKFNEFWCDPEGNDLLENRIYVDYGTREWYDPRSQVWVSFYDAHPPVQDVAGEELCGLDKIIAQIHEETGVRFTTYLSGWDIDRPDPDDLDPECYEDLHGLDSENPLSAIHLLVHGAPQEA